MVLVGSISAFIRIFVIYLGSTTQPDFACRGASSLIDQGFWDPQPLLKVGAPFSYGPDSRVFLDRQTEQISVTERARCRNYQKF
jgi:hypothetical protein